MKTLEFIYQETQIHFLVNPLEKNVMVNATEMAKIFNKDVREFLKLNSTKNYIKSKLKRLNNEGNSPHYNEDFLFTTNKKAGTYMLRPLALKFAAWLDTDFDVWIFDTIDNILFEATNGIAKEVLLKQEKQLELERLKKSIISKKNEDAIKLLQLQKEIDAIYRKEVKAVKILKNQLKLF